MNETNAICLVFSQRIAHRLTGAIRASRAVHDLYSARGLFLKTRFVFLSKVGPASRNKPHATPPLYWLHPFPSVRYRTLVAGETVPRLHPECCRDAHQVKRRHVALPPLYPAVVRAVQKEQSVLWWYNERDHAPALLQPHTYRPLRADGILLSVREGDGRLAMRERPYLLRSARGLLLRPARGPKGRRLQPALRARRTNDAGNGVLRRLWMRAGHHRL